MCLALSLSLRDNLADTLASKFSLTDGETDLVAADPAFRVHPTVANDPFFIGRVITDKDLYINFIFPNVMRLLHTVKGAAIKSISTNVFVIKFNHALDRTKALGGCPWVLDRHALILEPIDPSTKPKNQDLTFLPIVARVMNLSLPNRSLQVARLIGNSLGGFVETPSKEDSFYTPYFLIKVKGALAHVLFPMRYSRAWRG